MLSNFEVDHGCVPSCLTGHTSSNHSRVHRFKPEENKSNISRNLPNSFQRAEFLVEAILKASLSLTGSSRSAWGPLSFSALTMVQLCSCCSNIDPVLVSYLRNNLVSSLETVNFFGFLVSLDFLVQSLTAILTSWCNTPNMPGLNGSGDRSKDSVAFPSNISVVFPSCP